jgi:DNA-binding CsgD family transcriptional regulator
MFQAPMALTYVDAFEEAEAVYAAAIEGARRFGLEYIFTMALGHRADTMYRSGSLRQAVADAGAAIEGGRGGWIELQARPLLTCSLLDMGDVDAARAAIQLRNVEQWSGATHIALFHEAVGRVRLAESRPTEALVAFREAGRIATESTALNPAFSAWRSGAAEAARALGALDEAKRLAAEEVELAKTFGAARAIGIALRVRGLVEGGSNGIDSLRESVDVLAASPARLEHARALTDLGAALRRSGAKSEARDHLRLGLDLAADCGATGLANRARSELVAAGGKPRRERISGIDSLTPQEHRIAELAAGGQSNREIAQALFLTRKTIETHLSNVYAKLGIRSRAELTAALHSDAG